MRVGRKEGDGNSPTVHRCCAEQREQSKQIDKVDETGKNKIGTIMFQVHVYIRQGKVPGRYLPYPRE